MSDAFAAVQLREAMKRRNHTFPSLTYDGYFTLKNAYFSIPANPPIGQVEDLAHRLLLCYPRFCLIRCTYDHEQRRLDIRGYV